MNLRRVKHTPVRPWPVEYQNLGPDTFAHDASTGFIHIWSLPQVVAAKARGPVAPTQGSVATTAAKPHGATP